MLVQELCCGVQWGVQNLKQGCGVGRRVGLRTWGQRVWQIAPQGTMEESGKQGSCGGNAKAVDPVAAYFKAFIAEAGS